VPSAGTILLQKSISICIAGAFCIRKADRARDFGGVRKQDVFTQHFHTGEYRWLTKT